MHHYSLTNYYNMKKIFTLCIALMLALTAIAGNNKSTKYPQWFQNNRERNKTENTLRGDPDYSTNQLSNYTSVTLPYNGTVTLSNTSETINIPGEDINACPARGFTFNVSDGTGIKISLSGDNISCVLSSSRTLTEESKILMLYDEDDSAPFSCSITTNALEAGEYTLFVTNDLFLEGEVGATITIETAEPEPDYTDVDYSKTIKLGETIYGTLDDNHGEKILTAFGAPFDMIVNGYSFEAKRGKTYVLNLEGSEVAAFLLKSGELTGSTSNDVVEAFVHTFTVPADGTYRLLIIGERGHSNYYKMSIEELVINSVPTFQEISLPYYNQLIVFSKDKVFDYFDPEEGHNTSARGFKFTLTEDAEISIYSYSGDLDWWAYFAIYDSAPEGNEFGEFVYYGEGDESFSLNAGTYYLVLDDDDYPNENGGGTYFCELDIKINNVSAAENAPAEFESLYFQEITLPYSNEELTFKDYEVFDFYDPEEGHNTSARGFKFTLTEDAKISIYSFSDDLDWWAYCAIYDTYPLGETPVDYIGYLDGEGRLLLNAGTYYLVFDDDGYTDEHGSNSYYCQVDINIEPFTAKEFKLKEVLDNATVITYSDDLSYFDMANELPTLCDEVLDDDEDERLAYCAAYKITLSDGDKITINHHASDDAFLLVYTKNSEGEYVLYTANDDGGNYHDSEIVLSIGEEDDAEDTYYIVATTYSNLSNESYIFTILGKNGVEQELQFTAIASDVESLTVEDINNPAEILFKLADLKIYGLINGTDNKLLLGNGLDYWEISEDNTTATYLPDTDNEAYPFAENIDDLVITIKQHVSGINHVSKENNVLVYGANGDINVRGTEGGESIVVYNIYGSIVTRSIATGDLTTINVPNGGIYIVRVGNKGFKVIL